MAKQARAKRHAKRLMVELWDHGSGRKVTGFTTNISATGMYVATRTVVPAGTRVRVQFKHHDTFLAAEAEIVRVLKQPLELRGIQSDGVGVRFLSVAELVGDLLGGVAVREQKPSVRPSAPAPNERPPADGSLSGPQPPSPGGESSNSEGATDSQARRYRVTFRGPEHFRRVVARDLVTGGLFLTTEEPPAIDEWVTVEIAAPGESTPVIASARVVYCREARTVDGAPNLLSGVGVELVDKERILAALENAVARSALRTD